MGSETDLGRPNLIAEYEEWNYSFEKRRAQFQQSRALIEQGFRTMLWAGRQAGDYLPTKETVQGFGQIAVDAVQYATAPENWRHPRESFVNPGMATLKNGYDQLIHPQELITPDFIDLIHQYTRLAARELLESVGEKIDPKRRELMLINAAEVGMAVATTALISLHSDDLRLAAAAMVTGAALQIYRYRELNTLQREEVLALRVALEQIVNSQLARDIFQVKEFRRHIARDPVSMAVVELNHPGASVSFWGNVIKQSALGVLQPTLAIPIIGSIAASWVQSNNSYKMFNTARAKFEEMVESTVSLVLRHGNLTDADKERIGRVIKEIVFDTTLINSTTKGAILLPIIWSFISRDPQAIVAATTSTFSSSVGSVVAATQNSQEIADFMNMIIGKNMNAATAIGAKQRTTSFIELVRTKYGYLNLSPENWDSHRSEAAACVNEPELIAKLQQLRPCKIDLKAEKYLWFDKFQGESPDGSVRFPMSTGMVDASKFIVLNAPSGHGKTSWALNFLNLWLKHEGASGVKIGDRFIAFDKLSLDQLQSIVYYLNPSKPSTYETYFDEVMGNHSRQVRLALYQRYPESRDEIDRIFHSNGNSNGRKTANWSTELLNDYHKFMGEPWETFFRASLHDKQLIAESMTEPEYGQVLQSLIMAGVEFLQSTQLFDGKVDLREKIRMPFSASDGQGVLFAIAKIMADITDPGFENPLIYYIDEPEAGLDKASAQRVFKYLNRLRTMTGDQVIWMATVHRSEEEIDQLLEGDLGVLLNVTNGQMLPSQRSLNGVNIYYEDDIYLKLVDQMEIYQKIQSIKQLLSTPIPIPLPSHFLTFRPENKAKFYAKNDAIYREVNKGLLFLADLVATSSSAQKLSEYALSLINETTEGHAWKQMTTLFITIMNAHAEWYMDCLIHESEYQPDNNTTYANRLRLSLEGMSSIIRMVSYLPVQEQESYFLFFERSLSVLENSLRMRFNLPRNVSLINFYDDYFNPNLYEPGLNINDLTAPLRQVRIQMHKAGHNIPGFSSLQPLDYSTQAHGLADAIHYAMKNMMYLTPIVLYQDQNPGDLIMAMSSKSRQHMILTLDNSDSKAVEAAVKRFTNDFLKWQSKESKSNHVLWIEFGKDFHIDSGNFSEIAGCLKTITHNYTRLGIITRKIPTESIQEEQLAYRPFVACLHNLNGEAMRALNQSGQICILPVDERVRFDDLVLMSRTAGNPDLVAAFRQSSQESLDKNLFNELRKMFPLVPETEWMRAYNAVELLKQGYRMAEIIQSERSVFNDQIGAAKGISEWLEYGIVKPTLLSRQILEREVTTEAVAQFKSQLILLPEVIAVLGGMSPGLIGL